MSRGTSFAFRKALASPITQVLNTGFHDTEAQHFAFLFTKDTEEEDSISIPLFVLAEGYSDWSLKCGCRCGVRVTRQGFTRIFSTEERHAHT